MFQMGLVDAMQADREREIESAIRRRRLLRPEDGAIETATPQSPIATLGRRLAVRARPTGG